MEEFCRSDAPRLPCVHSKAGGPHASTPHDTPPCTCTGPSIKHLSTGSLCTITPSALTHSSALRSTCRSACAERAAAGPVVLFLPPAGAPTSAAPPARERAPSTASTSKARRAPQRAKRQRPRHAGTGQRQPHPRRRHANPCMRRTCSAPASRGRAPGHARPCQRGVSEGSARLLSQVRSPPRPCLACERPLRAACRVSVRSVGRGTRMPAQAAPPAWPRMEQGADGVSCPPSGLHGGTP